MSEEVSQLQETLRQTTGPDRLPLLISLGFALHEIDAHEGIRICQEGQRLAEQIGDLRAQATLQLVEAFNLGRLGAYDHALALIDQVQPLLEAAGDVEVLARSWNIRGVILSNLGRFDEALHHLLLSMGTLEETMQYWGLCAILINLGIAYDRLGRHDVAHHYHQRALKLSVSTGRFDTQLSAVTNLGSNQLHLGRYQESLDYSREALSLARSIGHAYVEVIATGNMAEAYSGLGQHGNAHAYFDDAVRQARRMNATECLVEVLYQKSRLCLATGDTAQAISLIQEALPVVDQMGGYFMEGTYLVHLAEAQLAHGQPDDAARHLRLALERTQDRRTVPARSRASFLLSSLHQQAGEQEQAEGYRQQHEDAERASRDQVTAWARAMAWAEQQAEDRNRAHRASTGASEPRPPGSAPEDAASVHIQSKAGGAGLHPRPAFLRRLDEQLEDARRRFEDVALLVAAADTPRRSDQAHIDDVGLVIEQLLRAEARAIGRLGPNVAALLQASPDQAAAVASRLIQQVRELHWTGQPERRVTVSVGCCTMTGWSQAEDMLLSGERLLRQAQGLGGNRTVSTVQQLI